MGAGASGGIALGTGAQVTAAGGTAIGNNAIAARGALAGYTAFGLATPQTSAGEFSVGAANAARQITNVAAGSDATDAVNVAQLQGVAAQIGTLDASAVRYDAADRARVTLGGATGTVLANVAPGAVAANSTEAVNGAQLFATNGAVTNNTTAITNLSTNVNNGAVGAVRYSDAGTPTVPNGGVPTNDVTVVGAAPGPVGVHNVRDGVLAAGSTDAVNGGQLFATNTQLTATGDTVTNVDNRLTTFTTNVSNGAVGTVRYSDPSNPTVPNGGTPTNDLALVGATAGAVGLHNVGPGVLAAGSTDAVNGDQLFATNGAVTTNSTAITNLSTSISNGGIGILRFADAANPNVPNGGVPTNDAVLVGAAAGPVGIHNVRDAVLTAGSLGAVNGGQLFALGTGVAGAIGGGTSYDPATNALNVQLNYNGTQYNTIQGVVTALSNTVVGGTASRFFTVNSVGAGATATGADGVAIGPNAQATAAGSVALGANAVATRGGQAGYAAIGLAGPQTSTGEVSIGAAGATRQLTNVAAGSAATDAVNVAQLQGATAGTIRYDDATQGRITLAGTGGTVLGNVAGGAVGATSTEAVNGAQLFATNQVVAGNTTAITNLGNSIANGATGPVQYSNPGQPTVPNGGIRTNDLTLVGSTAAPVVLHNVGNGAIRAGSTDAVNGGQVFALAQTSVNAVTYNTDANGVRTNTITLAGGNAGAPVVIANVASGTLAANSTQAVNGGQLFATNQAVSTAQTTANTALTLSNNSVQYDGDRGVTLNPGSMPVQIHNVAVGTAMTDAVSVMQLNTSTSNAITQANNYTDMRLQAVTFDLRQARRDAYAGTASALAAAGLPQAYEAGKGMIAIGGSAYMNASAVAFGFSKAFTDGHTVVKLSGSYDSRNRVGASGGLGYQF